jgi:hypothetical protein
MVRSKLLALFQNLTIATKLKDSESSEKAVFGRKGLHCNKKSVLKIQEYIHEGANLKFYIPEFLNFKLLIPEYSPI